jgi:Zn-dependent protease
MISPLLFVFQSLALVLSLALHEFAHAWSADRLGDPTPRVQGRVTLNPLKHLDPFGTVALLFTRFGWGKPVEIDPYNFKHPIRDQALVAAAGPAMNLVIASVCWLVAHFLPPELMVVAVLASFVGQINITLAIFNLVPIAPLDGSKIVLALLPPHLSYSYQLVMQRYGLFILILFIAPWSGGSSPASLLLGPLLSFFSQYFI